MPVKLGDTVTFFVQGEKSRRIDLGKVDLKQISNVTSGTTPTFDLIGFGYRHRRVNLAATISNTDATVKVAMR